MKDWPGVRQPVPDLQIYVNSGGLSPMREPGGIVKQDFGAAGKEQERWQSRQVGIERRRQRIGRRGLPEVDVSPFANGFTVKHYIVRIIGVE